MLQRFRNLFSRKAMTPTDMPWLAVSVSTAAGIAVSAETALRVPAVSACIRTIAEAAASLDVHVVAGERGAEVEAPDHPVAVLLQGHVNDWTSGPAFVRDLVIDALMRDEGGLAWVNRVGGRPREVLHYVPGRIAVSYLETGEPIYALNGAPQRLADIIHLRPPFGRAPLTLAREAIGLAAVMERHASTLFANGGRPSGVLQMPGRLNPDAAQRLKESWNDRHSGGSAGGTAVLEEGMSFNPLSFSSVDAQFVELRTFQLQEICRAFRVSPHLIYDLGRATWSNSEQLGLEFLTYSLEPWLVELEAALGRALFSDDERRQGYRVRFDRDDLTRADLGARATAYSSLIAARVLNPNEARKWDGLPSYAGGDAFANPHVGEQGSNSSASAEPTEGSRNESA